MAATAAAAAGADFHYGNAAGGGVGYNGAVCVYIMTNFKSATNGCLRNVFT